ncbi:MAG: hypothetical protein IPI78_02835 [Chitinophagaceae bacterium]|nr:hypothetical protein [Chitinophagaceae bacterium]
MRKIYKFSLFTLLLITLTNVVFAQNRFFHDAGKNKSIQTTKERVIIPKEFRTSTMDVQAMKSFLWTLPSESSVLYNRGNAPVISIPMPDGSMAKFHVWESNIMEPALAAKFPDMKQFLGQGIDDPYATIRFDYNPYTGFHAQILSSSTGRIFIDPFANGDLNNYISYFARNAVSSSQFVCNVDENLALDNPSPTVNRTAAACLGTNLRTYRLALACTGEYAVAVNGATPTTGGVAAAMLTAVNRVTGVYENEVSVRLQLVANNDLLIYLDGATEPYTNNSGGTMLGQNQTNCDAVIGSANYDIGHVFSTGGGGVAGLGVICNNGNKARGVTGLGNPVGDAFYIDYVAHEMGHQFGGNHTFNSVTSSCGGGNRNNSTAYEVGSGTTIQAYAGICGSDNIQPNSDPFFHAISFDEISNRVNGTSCAAITATGNTLPVINPLVNSGLTIPINTPFTLSGTASDANGDPLTYSWEEMDLGPGGAWNGGATSTTAPLFKSRVPKTTGDRTFPDMAVILAGYPANPAATLGGLKGETLPTVARAMNFRLTVRDNRAGGGGVASSGTLGCQTSTAFIVNTAGTTPFSVTAPNGGESYPGGTSQTITWNNAGTTAAPFNVANVRITLSTDGGLTYPTVISASTPNDGTEALTIPAVVTTTAKIKIEAIGNIFFDISSADFSITAASNGFSFNSPAAVTASCPVPNVMTSGNLTATYQGTFTGSINLTGTVTPAGPTVSFSNPILTTGSPSSTVSLTGMATLSPGNYVVTVTGTGVGGGNPVQTRDITFTINPGAGPAVTTHPSSQAICVDNNVTFNAAGTGITGYQWQVSTNGGLTWNPIVGAMATSYTITGVTFSLNNNQYRCVFTGQCGTTNTNPATLTVNTLPNIAGQPSNIAVCSGSSATFTATATGTSITYQWQISTTGMGGTYSNLSNVAPYSNVGTATLIINPTTTGLNGNYYRCVVSGTCTPPATSNPALLTVNSSVTVTGNPSNQTICEGTGTSFTSFASGSGLMDQWEVSTNGGGTWANVVNNANYAGATTPTLTLTNVPPTFNNYRYRNNITSPPCTPGITTAATLTVNTFPVITSHPSNLTICEGANSTFTVGATTGVGALTYQWQFRQTPASAWVDISGATSSTFSQSSVIGQNGYQFRVIVTAGCGSSNSNPATITVNAYPVASITNLPTTLCLSDPAYSLTASLAGGVWNGPGVTGNNFTPSAAGLGTKTINYVLTNAGCVTTKTSIIQVNECADRHRRLYEFQAFKLYPTPNDGRFSIRLNSDLYNTLGVRIYNSLGQQVHAEQFSGLTYGSVVSLDIAGVPRGVYQVFVYSADLDKVDSKGVSIIVNQ